MAKQRLPLGVTIASALLLLIGFLIIGTGVRQLAIAPASWPVLIGLACGVCMVAAVVYLWVGTRTG